MALLSSLRNLLKIKLNTKSHSGDTIKLTSTGSLLQILDGFFNLNTGAKDLRRFVDIAYGNNPLVYAAVDRIAQKTSTLERKVSGPSIAQQLFQNPNPDQNQIEFDRLLATELLTTGNVFLLLTRGIGAGFSWRVAQSYNVEILIDNVGNITGYAESRNGFVQTWDVDDVLHIKYPNIVTDSSAKGIDHLYGTSPLHAAWETVIASNEIFNAEASIFKNRGIAGILTNNTNVPLTPDNRELLQEELNNQIGGSENYNKILAINNNAQYIQTSMSPTDLKLIENNVSKLRTICSVYHLNSVPFNDPANTAYNNVKESAFSNMVDAFLPIADKVDMDKSRYLTKNFGNTEIEVDRDVIEVLQREDIQEDPTNTPVKQKDDE